MGREFRKAWLAAVVLMLLFTIGVRDDWLHEWSNPQASLEGPRPAREAFLRTSTEPNRPSGIMWSASAVPIGRDHDAMAYDSESDRVILFGGLLPNSVLLNDTWAYDYNTDTWTNMSPSASPVRSLGAMVYDSESDRVILFGGAYNSDDTWAYDFNTNTWTKMNPTVKPSGRSAHAMAYDSQSDRVILGGGGDTWAYDYNSNTWTNMNPAAMPPTRYYHAMTYDSRSDRVILFGGYNGTTQRNDTWAYDYNANTWTNLNPIATPLARSGHVMAYDSQSDRVILFGGCCTLADTWAYEFNMNTWTSMVPAAGPPPRDLHTMAYDSESDRVIIFGGNLINKRLNDTWAYNFEGNSWAVGLFSAPRALTASLGSAQVRLNWQAPFSNGGWPIIGYNIYRGVTSGNLVLVASVRTVLTYYESGLTNGVTYFYAVDANNALGRGPLSNEISGTPSPSADPVPPKIAIVSLANNRELTSATIVLNGTASDNLAIERVEVSTDGASWILASGTTSWSVNLTLHEGSNTITVRATDTSGNVATSTVTVTVRLTGLTPLGVEIVGIGLAAGAAIITIAVVVSTFVSNAVSSGSSTLTGKRAPFPARSAARFLKRRKRGSGQIGVHDRLFYDPSSWLDRSHGPFLASKGVLRESQVLADAGTAVDMKSRGPWLFGRYGGFPVVVKEGGFRENHQMLFQVALRAEAVENATTSISDKERVRLFGLRPAGLRVERSIGELIYVHTPSTPITRTKPEDVTRILFGLVALATADASLGTLCAKCRTKPSTGVIIVNGLPTQLCATDLDRIIDQEKESRAATSDVQPSYVRGLVFGLGGMMLGAGIWAAIGILTGYVFSLAAFGISVLIAALLARGAQHVTVPLAGIMALLTMLAIFIGDVIWVGVVLTHLTTTFDLLAALGAYITIVKNDPQVLLSYVFGFIGIVGTVGYMTKTARRARAPFEVVS